MSDPVLRIVPLGGLGEVGKNMMVYELGDELVVVDAGLSFPRDEQLGVDLVLPDFGYLAERKNNIRAVLLTHGHEDHVGALPYPLLREVGAPAVYGTKLTLELVASKLDEHGLLRSTSSASSCRRRRDRDRLVPRRARSGRALDPGLGGDRARHAGGSCRAHGGLQDRSHARGRDRTDVGRLADIGNEGVDLLLGDSTNAERPGVSTSGRLVGEAFRQIIPLRQGRVLVSSFLEHPPDAAGDRRRAGGSQGVRRGALDAEEPQHARNLDYVRVPEDTLVKPNELDLRPDEVLILCSGSQGEPLSALTRIAYNDHPAVRVERGDTVIISARPIPGNELRIHDTINGLAKLGAEVLHEENAAVHTSGHGHAEELHDDLAAAAACGHARARRIHRMLAAHGRLAQEGAGVPANAIVLAENGTVVELDERGPRVAGTVEAGVTFVDGLGVGDVRDVALGTGAICPRTAC